MLSPCLFASLVRLYDPAHHSQKSHCSFARCMGSMMGTGVSGGRGWYLRLYVSDFASSCCCFVLSCIFFSTDIVLLSFSLSIVVLVDEKVVSRNLFILDSDPFFF